MVRCILICISIIICCAESVRVEGGERQQAKPSVVELTAKIEQNIDAFVVASVDEKDDIAWSIRETLEALQKYGPDAAESVPLLVGILKECRKQHPISTEKGNRKPSHPVQLIESACIETLGAIGPDAAPAVPVLIEFLDDDELVRISTDMCVISSTFLATQALSSIGPPAVDSLIAALDHKSERTRYHALWAIGDMGSTAEKALNKLRTALAGDKEYMVRQQAAWTIAEIGCFSDETVASLVAALSDNEYVVRCAAAEALGDVRPARADVVDALLRAVDDQHEQVRVRAIRSLGSQGPAALKAVPKLIELLDSGEVYHDGHPVQEFALCEDAAAALGKIGPDAKAAIPALLRVIRDPQQSMGTLSEVSPQTSQENAIRAIMSIDPKNPELIALLLKIVRKNSRDYVMRKAVWALGRIGPPLASPAKPVLHALLKKNSQPKPVSVDEEEPFASVSFSSESIIPSEDLGGCDIWETQERDMLLVLTSALLRLEPDNNDTFQLAVSGLGWSAVEGIYVFWGDEGELLADAIVGSTAWKAEDTRRTVLRLVDRYLDRPPEEQTVQFDAPEPKAAGLMLDLDPGGRLAAPILFNRLQRMDPNDYIRDAIVEALSRAPDVIHPELEKMLKSSEPIIRADAIKILGGSTGNLPLIVAALRDPSTRVRLTALRILEKIGIKAATARGDIECLLNDKLLAIRLAAQKTLCAIQDD